MISRCIEISIAGGVVAMVRVLSLRPLGLPYIGIFTAVTQVTHHLALHNFNDSYESLCNIWSTNQNS